MKRYLLILAALLASPQAHAANSTVAAMTPAAALSGTELVYVVQGGGDRKATPAQFATYFQGLITGDCSISGNAIVCTKTNGVAFAPSATIDTTNATNIASGSLADARLTSNVPLKNASNAFTNANSFSGSTTWTGNLITPIRTVTAAGAITVSATTDYFICVKKTSGAATTVNLPASPTIGLTFLIKDCKGDAATNNITITPNAGNIDNSATLVLNANLQSVAVTFDGVGWFVN